MSSPAALPPEVGVIIVAAGAGLRAGSGELKQFRPIHGVPLLLRALRPFTSHPDVGRVTVALPAGVVSQPPEWLGKLRGERLAFVTGGATRTDSVRAALRALADDARIVLVHDAARPFVSREIIDAVIAGAVTGLFDGVADRDGCDSAHAGPGARIARTVPRDRLWRAQTPQAFPRPMLEEAYERLRRDDPPPTDDAELCERAGFPVDVVADTAYNLKVTTADDFRIAEALARDLR